MRNFSIGNTAKTLLSRTPHFEENLFKQKLKRRQVVFSAFIDRLEAGVQK